MFVPARLHRAVIFELELGYGFREHADTTLQTPRWFRAG